MGRCEKFALLVFVLAGCTAAPAVDRAEAVFNDPRKPIEVRIGDEFGIEAVAECRDGFHWRATPQNVALLLPVDQDEFMPGPTGGMRSGDVCSHDVFAFRALERGSTTVILESFRPEPIGGPTIARRTEYKVNIY